MQQFTMFQQIMLIICCLLVAGAIYGMIKSTIEFKQKIKILNAIYDYGVATDENPFKISQMYDSMKDLKWYDWEYENIVPREVYDKIKPYL